LGRTTATGLLIGLRSPRVEGRGSGVAWRLSTPLLLWSAAASTRLRANSRTCECTAASRAGKGREEQTWLGRGSVAVLCSGALHSRWRLHLPDPMGRGEGGRAEGGSIEAGVSSMTWRAIKGLCSTRASTFTLLIPVRMQSMLASCSDGDVRRSLMSSRARENAARRLRHCRWRMQVVRGGEEAPPGGIPLGNGRRPWATATAAQRGACRCCKPAVRDGRTVRHSSRAPTCQSAERRPQTAERRGCRLHVACCATTAGPPNGACYRRGWTYTARWTPASRACVRVDHLSPPL
jgi:hypothetical protein